MFDELVVWPRSSWSVFDELESLRSVVHRSLDAAEAGRTARIAYPPMNVWSSADGLIIDAELPGVDPKEVDISVQGDELTLRGKVNVAEPQQAEKFYRRERPAGEFTRTLQLPFRAEAGAVKANYKNGLLRLVVPRSEQEKPRKIAIEAA